MEKRRAEYNRHYDENFWLNHRWDREVWCQSCKIHHGMREEAREKCEERKKVAKKEEEKEKEEEKRRVEARGSRKSPCYHDFQERPPLSREESPEEEINRPRSPPRVNHGAEAWAFYLERQEQKRKKFITDSQQRGASNSIRLRALAPVPQSSDDTLPLPHDRSYLTSSSSSPSSSSTFQSQAAGLALPSPAQQTAQNQNLYMLNASQPQRQPQPPQQQQQQPSQNAAAFTAPKSTSSELLSLSGAVENLQRLPPINTQIFGPMPDIHLRNPGYNPLPEGRIEAGLHFGLGSPFPTYSALPDQEKDRLPPTAVSVSDGRYDEPEVEEEEEEEERGFFSPYTGSKPAGPGPRPAVLQQSGRQEGISQTHTHTHPPSSSREQRSESTKRPLRRRPPPIKRLPLMTAEQSSRLGTLRSRKRKPSLMSINDLLCAEEEEEGGRLDDTSRTTTTRTEDFQRDIAPPARASTRRRLTSPAPSSSANANAAFALNNSYKSPSYVSNLIREEEREEEVEEGVEEGKEEGVEEGQDDDGDDDIDDDGDDEE